MNAKTERISAIQMHNATIPLDHTTVPATMGIREMASTVPVSNRDSFKYRRTKSLRQCERVSTERVQMDYIPISGRNNFMSMFKTSDF